MVYLFNFGRDFFIFDDNLHILNNGYITNFSLSNLFRIWTESFIPVIYTIWSVLAFFFGTDNAIPYKVINLLVHIINCRLVYYVTCSLIQSYQRNNPQEETAPEKIYFYSSLGALVYAIHPVQVEAIVWVSSLKDLISTFFALTSLLLFFQYRNTGSKDKKIIVLSFFSLFLGTLTKPNTLVIFFIFGFLDYFVFRAFNWKRNLRYYSVFVLYCVILVLLHLVDAHTSAKALYSDHNIFYTISSKALVVSHALMHYFSTTLFPFPLGFYMKTPGDVLVKGLGFFNFLFLFYFMLTIGFLSRNKKLSYIFIPISLFTLLILPNLGIFINPFQESFSYVADRYLNLPLLGLSVLISWSLLKANTVKFKKAYLPVFAVFIIFLTGMTTVQTKLWKYSSTILTHSASFTPPHLHLYSAIINAHQKEHNAKEYYHWLNKLQFFWPVESKVILKNFILENKSK